VKSVTTKVHAKTSSNQHKKNYTKASKPKSRILQIRKN